MSTRANVVIKGESTFYLYHHCDGYPSFLGVTLRQYLSKKMFGAHDAAEIANDIIKGRVTFTNSKGETIVDDDYRLTECVHGDIDYLYMIDCSKHTLTCYDVMEVDCETNLFNILSEATVVEF